MKSVLISNSPEQCQNIINRRQTIIIKKTRPKLKTPFKCYNYCTQDFTNFATKTKRSEMWIGEPLNSVSKGRYLGNGKVISDFVCDDIIELTAEFTDDKTYEDIRYCYLDEYEEEQEMILVSNEWDDPDDSWICKESCLSFDNFKKYIGENFHDIPFYGFYISDLKVYDKPKELSEFKKINRKCYFSDLGLAIPNCCDCKYEQCMLLKPFKSWGYVEELQK